MNTSDIEQYLRANSQKGLLRLVTCGDMNNGTHIFIGGNLVESPSQPEDLITTAQQAFNQWGTEAPKLDLIHIPVHRESDQVRGSSTGSSGTESGDRTDRFFLSVATDHEQQSIHNMILDASDADIAVILVDAHHGVDSRTRGYTHLVSLVGFNHVLLIITGLDKAHNARSVYDNIVDDFISYSQRAGILSFTAIPLLPRQNDNAPDTGADPGWYRGQTLIDFLLTLKPDNAKAKNAPCRLIVRSSLRTGNGGIQHSGFVTAGTLHSSDRVRVQPLGRESRITRIFTGNTECDEAVSGQNVMVVLQDEFDIPPGSVISTAEAPVEVADQFEARIVWLHNQSLYPGRPYLIRMETGTVSGTITDIKYQVNVDTLEHLAANKLDLNGIGVCNISLDRAVAFEPYDSNRGLGAFTLVDRLSGDILGAGMLNFALRRAHNIHLQHLDIDKETRVYHKGHRPCVLWFTGLSGSGKSAVANMVEKKLYHMGAHTYLMDGDNVRHGLSRDLGFTDADRVENIRRVAEVSKLMVDAGLIVLTAFISPFRAERRMARELFPPGEFIEVFIDTPLEVAEQRDPKGLYKKARRGDLKNFTGIDSPYEMPEFPELRVDTTMLSPESAADMILNRLIELGILQSGKRFNHAG